MILLAKLVLDFSILCLLTLNCLSSDDCTTGWPLINRPSIDSDGWTFVSIDKSLTCGGKVTKWTYYGLASRPFRAIVFRPVDFDSQFSIVGINDIPAGATYTSVSYIVPEQYQIEVQSGDVIGWSHGGGVIAWNGDGGYNVRYTGGNLYAGLVVDQVLHFGSVSTREYSIIAHVEGLDECASTPCHNGGACIDAIEQYTCQCTSGWKGTNCNVEIDECLSNPCQNDGTCTDYINRYQCACPAWFYGVDCSLEDTSFTFKAFAMYTENALVNHAFTNVYARSNVECMVKCLINRNCVSSNFGKPDKTCELNTSSKSGDSKDFVYSRNRVYIE